MPDYRLMPDICTLTVRAKKWGLVCPYPMGGTRFNTGSLEQQQRTRGALEQTRVSSLGENKQHQPKNPPGCSCLNGKRRPSLLQLFGVTDKATSHFWNSPNSGVTHSTRLSPLSPTTGCFSLLYQKAKIRDSFVTDSCVLLPSLTFKVGHGPNSEKNWHRTF